jgi:signal transduction histidine kinase
MTVQQTVAPVPPVNTDRRLEALLQTAQQFPQARDLKDLVSCCLSCVIGPSASLGRAILFLYDASEEHLIVQSTEGYDLTALDALRFAPNEGMIGEILTSGRGKLYPDPASVLVAKQSLTSAQRNALRRAAKDQCQTQSAVVVPLLAANTKIGVLLIENLGPSARFTESHLVLMERLSGLLALAIENQQLKQHEPRQATYPVNQFAGNEALAVLAHEMRTLLTSIKGYSTALLADEITFSPEKQREFLQLIDRDCDALETLIRDILESSLLDSGRLRLEWQPIKLPRLARQIVDELERFYPHHRIIVTFPADFPVIEGDPERITQVLRNLLDNAAKYSPRGGIIVVHGERTDDEVVTSVADQGIGIAPEHLNRLFEKFFRVKSRDTRRTTGSGLGLPIARALIEAHGGRIWAESQLGHGSIFYFALPLTHPEEESAARSTA